MTHRSPPAGTALLAVVLLTVVACSEASPNTNSGPTGPQRDVATTVEPSTTARTHEPAGMIAIGHSGLTGYNADPARPDQNAWDLSWATGDAPEVNSVATRLVAAHPNAKGLIWNAAGNGADVTALVGQAEQAVEYVPTPELVIVQVIDNDIRCDGTDAENVAAFGAHLAEALETIAARSPTAKIVVFGYLGFPTPDLVKQFVARTPELQAAVSGDGPCDPYDPQGNLVPANFEYLREVVDAYEAEQARVCATVPACVTDGGRAAAFPESVELHSADGHLNASGHAATAELLWPVVADALGV